MKGFVEDGQGGAFDGVDGRAGTGESAGSDVDVGTDAAAGAGAGAGTVAGTTCTEAPDVAGGAEGTTAGDGVMAIAFVDRRRLFLGGCLTLMICRRRGDRAISGISNAHSCRLIRDGSRRRSGWGGGEGAGRQRRSERVTQ